MERIKFNYFRFILFVTIALLGSVQCQKYAVDIWGLPIGSAELKWEEDDRISFIIEPHGFVQNIYPLKLAFSSKFNTSNYTIIENSKTVKQGRDQQRFDTCLADGVSMVYRSGDSINVTPETYSWLSFLAKSINLPIDKIDTKWFNIENEGGIYKARLLWNDSTIVSLNNEDISCDHFRIDLKILDNDKIIFEKTDYFTELFFDINSIRQIWIERWQKQRRLVKITIKNKTINLNVAVIN